MAPITKLSALAFASAVLAIPHSNQHRHLHARGAPPEYGAGSSAAPASSGAPPAYGSSSAAPVSSGAPPAYGSSSAAPASGSSSLPPYPMPSGSSSGGAWGTGTGYSSSYLAPTGYSSSDCPVKSTTLIWKSSTKVVPVYGESSAPAGYGSASAVPASSAAPASSAPAYGNSGSGSGSGAGAGASCAADVTVTTKVYETVTVTAGGYGSSAAPESSAAPVSSAAPEYSGPVEKYGGPGHWGWGESSEAAPATSAPAASSYSGASSYGGASSAAPHSSRAAPPSYSAPASSGSPASSSAAPSSYPSESSSPSPPSGGAFRGKRGLAYNDVSLCSSFADAPSIGWGFNWVQDGEGFPSGLSYIPELHTSHDSYFTSNWNSNAQKAIDNGAKYLFSLNEPDMPSQANISPQDAVAVWKQYMEPFHEKATLVAPSVTNGQGDGIGQDWLKQFIDACTDCHIGAINQHWYDSTSNDVDFFKGQISSAADFGYPVFVGEFGAIGSDEDISSFLEEVMPWMDSNDSIVGYAYYMVDAGLLVDGDAPSAYGQTYCDA